MEGSLLFFDFWGACNLFNTIHIINLVNNFFMYYKFIVLSENFRLIAGEKNSAVRVKHLN